MLLIRSPRGIRRWGTLLARPLWALKTNGVRMRADAQLGASGGFGRTQHLKQLDEVLVKWCGSVGVV